MNRLPASDPPRGETLDARGAASASPAAVTASLAQAPTDPAIPAEGAMPIETWARWAAAERRLVVASIVADVAHDLAAPTVYFEGLARALEKGHTIDADEIAAAREEAARLRRLLVAMRVVELREPPRVAVDARALVAGAVRYAVARDGGHAVPVAIDVAHGLAIAVDEESLVILIAVLVRNAVAAVREAACTAIGVHVERADRGWSVEVWDSGAGAFGSLPSNLFSPFRSLSPAGGGLGIATALRIARRCGWRMTYGCEGGKTSFRIAIPFDETETRP